MLSTMKKYIPVFIAIFGLSFYLVSQGVFNFGDPTATTASKQVKQTKHFEKMLSSFKGTTRDGKELQSKDLPKVVILNFWASWCTPCLEEFPSLVAFQEKYKEKGALVIGINTDEVGDRKDVDKAIKKYKLNFPVILDKDGKFINDFLVNAIPISIVYKDGKVQEVSQGSKDFMAAEFTESVDKWLK